VQASDVVDAAEDRAARRGGKKGRARWLATRVAAAGTGSPHGSAGGRRNVPGQPGAAEHHRDRLPPEEPDGPAVAEHRERHRRVRRGRRRARSAAGWLTGGCLALGAAGCDRAGHPDDGDHANQGPHGLWTRRAAGRFRSEDIAERQHSGLRDRALLYPGPQGRHRPGACRLTGQNRTHARSAVQERTKVPCTGSPRVRGPGRQSPMHRSRAPARRLSAGSTARPALPRAARPARSPLRSRAPRCRSRSAAGRARPPPA
jgi:hypothetical protein